MAAAPRQCACTHSRECAAFFDLKTGDMPGAPTVFARSGSLQFLALPKNESCAEG